MTAIAERLAQTVRQKLEDFRSYEGTVFLERVPENLRKSIWNCEEKDLRNLVISVSAHLVELGQKPLNNLEVEEAIDGWGFLHGGASPQGQTRTSSAG